MHTSLEPEKNLILKQLISSPEASNSFFLTSENCIRFSTENTIDTKYIQASVSSF